MRGRKRRSAWLVAVLAGTVAACTSPKHGGLSPDFQKKLSEWSSGQAVEDAVARQTAPQAPAGQTDYLEPGQPVWIQSGKSRIIRVARPVRRVSIANPDLAGIVVLGPTTLMINAKDIAKPSQTQYGGMGAAMGTSESISGMPLTPIPEYAETTLVLWDSSGEATSHSILVADFIAQQVMLEVTVAEINRSSFEQHGIDFQSFNSSFASNFFLGGGAAPPLFTEADLSVIRESATILPLFTDSTRPTFAFRLPDRDITAFIQALQAEGMATILAQPKILAMSGQPALFQVGGEIPIRIVSSFIANIEFKPFGTLVNFVPQVTEEGDIFLTVTPEVSQPDFNSPVEGIPTFRTRRASTSVRLRNGETLVIGGLLQTLRVENVRGIPYLQDIPFVGHFFRDTTYDDQVTELMVIVTPRLATPFGPGERVGLPTDREPLTNEEIRTKPHPAKATRPRVPGLGTDPRIIPGMP